MTEEEAAIVYRAQKGDRAAQAELLKRCEPAVKYHAGRVFRSFNQFATGLEKEDYEQIARKGVLKAIKKCDPAKAPTIKFIGYATWWIRQQLYREGKKTLVKFCSARDIDRMFSKKAQFLLKTAANHSIHLDPEETAVVLDVSVDAIYQMRALRGTGGIVELSKPSNNTTGSEEHKERVEDFFTEEKLPSAWQNKNTNILDDESFWEQVKSVLAIEKPARDIRIFVLRVRAGFTLNELASKYDLSSERIRQIVEDCMELLRAHQDEFAHFILPLDSP